MRVRAALAVTAAVVLGTAACGVPVESAPRPVELPERIEPSPNPTPALPGTVSQTIYLVRDDHIVAVTRKTTGQHSAQEQLGQLMAGPTAQERGLGLSSALLGTELELTVQITAGRAVVELATGLDGTGRTDDILAFAQIVCTLTGRGDIAAVTFTRGGEQVEVPRADSSLTRDPLTAADYASLIVSQ